MSAEGSFQDEFELKSDIEMFWSKGQACKVHATTAIESENRR